LRFIIDDPYRINYLNLANNPCLKSFNPEACPGLDDLQLNGCGLTTGQVDFILESYRTNNLLHGIRIMDLSGQVPAAGPTSSVLQSFQQACDWVILNVDPPLPAFRVIIPDDDYSMALLVHANAGKSITFFGDGFSPVTTSFLSNETKEIFIHFDFAGEYLIIPAGDVTSIRAITTSELNIHNFYPDLFTGIESLGIDSSLIENLEEIVTKYMDALKYPNLYIITLNFQAEGQGISQALYDQFVAARPSVAINIDIV
jgi:hypothetical protein